MKLNQLLGDYELLKLVGKGGQGKVYKAFDTKLKRFVAIKIFHAKNDRNRSQKLASFKYEARLTSALNHPNICTVYALFEDDEYTYTVMEYIDGKNLFEIAYGRPLEIKSAVGIVIQVADALIAAHEKSIIHRDIKPRNVMVSREGRVVVLDFGLAKLLEKPDGSFDFENDNISSPKVTSGIFYEDIAEDLFVTVEGQPYGTPASSPPEMALGKPTDERGDVYAVGGLLYLLLTGTSPFLAKTIKEVRHKVITEEPVPITVARKAEGAIPLELIAIVRRALRKSPDERFQTMKELRERLDAILNDPAGSENEKNIKQFPSLYSASVPHYAASLPKKFASKPVTIFSILTALILGIVLACYIFY